MRLRETIFLFGLACLPLLAAAGTAPGRTGDAILKMCQGAERVQALSVMCHNYLNGFLDATAWDGKREGKGGAKFCLGAGDKERIPTTLVAWMKAHPDALKQESGEALHRMLSDSFPCGKKR
ncbi:MAG: Rap1a/Tai family immunity protein [Gallionellaceae bacterium]|nr:Rap1a/Tai family immunity protein [Gallionellaceae bacterium]